MSKLKNKNNQYFQKVDNKYIILFVLNSLSFITMLFFTLKFLIEKKHLSFIIILFFFLANFLNFLILLIKRKNNLSAKISVAIFYLLIILMFIFIPSNGYSLLWFFLFPPIAIFLIGKKNSTILFFSLISILALIYIFFPSILVSKYDVELLIRVLFVSLVISIIIFVYELNKEKNDLEMRKYIEEMEIQKEESLRAKDLLEKLNVSLELKNQEQIQQQKKHETLIENLGNGFAIIDYDGSFLYVNKILIYILERYKTEILQLNIKDLFAYSETLKILNSLEKIKKEKKDEIQVFYKINNTKKILNLIMYETYNEQERKKEVAIIIKDHTELWQREQMISQKTNELKISKKRLTEQNEELYTLKEVIEQKERRLSNILNNLGEAILIISNEQIITYSNSAANIISEKEDLRGLNLKDLISESQYKKIAKQFLIGPKDKFSNFDIEIPTKAGSVKHLSVTAVPDYNEKGQIIGTVAVMRDITELIENQQIIKEKMNQLSILINNLPAYVFFKDKELKYININDTYSKLIGKDKSEIIGNKYSLLFPEDKQVEETDMDVIHTHKPQLGVEIFKFGRWLNLSKVPYFDHKGEINGIIGIMVDITRQKLESDNLKKFQIAVENIPVGIVITNLKGEIIFSNSAFHKIIGYSFEEISRLTKIIISSGKIPLGHPSELFKSIIERKKYKAKFDFFNKKKNINFKIDCNYTPVYNDNNEIVLFVGSYVILDSEKL